MNPWKNNNPASVADTVPSSPRESQKVIAKGRRPAGAFGLPRDFLDNRFVYVTISPRARGLSIGLNLNPDGHCNFDCIYCEVNRSAGFHHPELDVEAMAAELDQTLTSVFSGKLRETAPYSQLPGELTSLRHVALSGDGEPTHCPKFVEVVESAVRLRARGRFPFFKLVLITNASGLDRPEVIQGLRLFNPKDEIWAKLDAGTVSHFSKVNRSEFDIEKIFENILSLGRQRPVVIQSLFPAISGIGPTPVEVEAYVDRLLRLKNAGANIPLVQIYSATRPIQEPDCGHLPLQTLSTIAQRVRAVTGLKAEVF